MTKWVCKSCNRDKPDIFQNGCDHCETTPLEPYCPKCDGKMEIGQAVKTASCAKWAWWIPKVAKYLDTGQIELETCLKCTVCGHSEKLG